MEIPENDVKRDFEGEVESACDEAITDFARHPKADWAEIGCTEALYHHVPAFNVDVLVEVARRFKAKGYFAHWAVNQKGRRYGLMVTKHPTNKDI